MQTRLADIFRTDPERDVAERILRNCVHCGFCLATCPSYQVLGNELDSPRGRIYLIKQVLEGATPTARTQLHLDRCLTCRSCETTCPSGVEYGRLLDIGRRVVNDRVGRGPLAALRRATLKTGLGTPLIFKSALALGRAVRPLLPRTLKARIPKRERVLEWPAPRHARRMLVLAGCVQPSLKPNINAATARVLDHLGISLVAAREAGCCGALAHHLDDGEAGRVAARRNIDAWIPHLDRGVEAIVMTASGCGAQVKDYGWLLRADPAYAEKAARVSAATRDVSEIVVAERDALREVLAPGGAGRRIAYHPPCTLQHAQGLAGDVETLLADAGFELTPVAEPHLCCGSAGTYSILQPAIAQSLKTRKLGNLAAGAPELIATANIGCLSHLQSGTSTPVLHWMELLDQALAATANPGRPA